MTLQTLYHRFSLARYPSTRFIISPNQVEKKISIQKATGPDEISSWVSETCALRLARPTCSVFKASTGVHQSSILEMWRRSAITKSIQCQIFSQRPQACLAKPRSEQTFGRFYIFLRKAFTFFDGRRLHFSTEGVYIFPRKAFTFFDGRRLHFSTEGVYIFLRKAFTFFYGRRLHFSTEGAYIFLRKAFTFFYGRRLHFSTEGVYIFRRKALTFFYGRRLHFSTEGVYIFRRKALKFFDGRCKISTEKFDL